MNPTNSAIPPMRKIDHEKMFWKDCAVCLDTSFSESEFLECCETSIHRACCQGIRDLRNEVVNE